MSVFVRQKKEIPRKDSNCKKSELFKVIAIFVQFPQLAFFIPFLERAFVKLVQTKDELKIFLIQQAAPNDL